MSKMCAALIYWGKIPLQGHSQIDIFRWDKWRNNIFFGVFFCAIHDQTSRENTLIKCNQMSRTFMHTLNNPDNL